MKIESYLFLAFICLENGDYLALTPIKANLDWRVIQYKSKGMAIRFIGTFSTLEGACAFFNMLRD